MAGDAAAAEFAVDADSQTELPSIPDDAQAHVVQPGEYLSVPAAEYDGDLLLRTVI